MTRSVYKKTDMVLGLMTSGQTGAFVYSSSANGSRDYSGPKNRSPSDLVFGEPQSLEELRAEMAKLENTAEHC